MPRRENEEEKLTGFVKPSAEPRLRELCRGEKIKNEIHRFLPVFRGKSYLCGIEMRVSPQK